MRPGRRVLVLLVLLVAAVVAFLFLRGGEHGGGEQVTHEQLVTRANAICSRLARENRALESPPRPYDFQSTEFFASVHENVTEAKQAFDELDPPADDADALDSLVEAYGRVEVDLDRIEAATSVSQEQEVVVVISEITRTVQQAAESERELGICAGDTSVLASIAAQLRRTRPNPLSETGPLGE
jgi:uncharacterized protein YheU (UPF0270 family)